MYGPTETTIWSSVWPVTERETPILIGKPIANTQMYILDQNLQPVPVGVPGELHIGGDGIASGYLHRDDLTTERFLSNPFTDNPSDRIYKTGDLARYMPNGDIECLGRLDFQVKVRGFRIELGEIESVLGQHESVRQGVVTAKDDASGTKILVAYVIVADGVEMDTAVLRAHLAEQLPHYMIPSVFMAVAAYPLTPNGKVDRRALPAPDETAVSNRRNYVAPRNETETELAQIWCVVLQVEQVGIYDNIFDLGGHSLLFARIIAQVREVLDIQLSLADIFNAPTVVQLAAKVDVMLGGDLGGADEKWRGLTPLTAMITLLCCEMSVWKMVQLPMLKDIPFHQPNSVYGLSINLILVSRFIIFPSLIACGDGLMLRCWPRASRLWLPVTRLCEPFSTIIMGNHDKLSNPIRPFS